MTIIEQARALGASLQQDERFKKFDEAAKLNDTNTDIQNKIGEFNLMRAQLNQEMSKPEKDADKMTQLDTDLRALYDEIMAMPTMVAFNSAKEELDKLLQSINYIITCAANGEDPMTCSEEPPHCSGSCASCGGCH
jgi:cell fate (sporulation/competence/biofilm development) regulator YlbF (YheA/YmcA/DUF963 family)